MARIGHGKHAKHVTVADDGTSPVGSDEWNANLDQKGMLGFTTTSSSIAISGGVLTTPDSVCVVTGEGGGADDLDSISLTDKNEYDLIYLYGQSGYNVTLKHRGQDNALASGEIETISGADEILSATKPTILMRKGSNWYGYGGGTASELDTTNFSTAAIVTAADTITSNDNDTTIPTSAAVKDLIEASVSVGDITSVVAGTGLTGGANSGAATLNVVGGTGITASADEITIDSTVATLSGSQTITGKDIVASQLTGTIADARMPDLTGDITTTEGAVVTAIGNEKVTEAMLKSSTAPQDDYILTADAAAAGGFKWAQASGGGDHTEQDFTIQAAHATDPASGTATLYVKTIDANNEGLFIKMKKNGSIQFVQVG